MRFVPIYRLGRKKTPWRGHNHAGLIPEALCTWSYIPWLTLANAEWSSIERHQVLCFDNLQQLSRTTSHLLEVFFQTPHSQVYDWQTRRASEDFLPQHGQLRARRGSIESVCRKKHTTISFIQSMVKWGFAPHRFHPSIISFNLPFVVYAQNNTYRIVFLWCFVLKLGGAHS